MKICLWKYAADPEIKFPKKSIFKPFSFTSTTRQRWSKINNIDVVKPNSNVPQKQWIFPTVTLAKNAELAVTLMNIRFLWEIPSELLITNPGKNVLKNVINTRLVLLFRITQLRKNVSWKERAWAIRFTKKILFILELAELVSRTVLLGNVVHVLIGVQKLRSLMRNFLKYSGWSISDIKIKYWIIEIFLKIIKVGHHMSNFGRCNRGETGYIFSIISNFEQFYKFL